MSRTLTNYQKGFTIVELLVVMMVMGVLAGLVFNVMGDLYQSNVDTIGAITQLSDTRSALHTIEDNMTVSAGVLGDTNSLADAQNHLTKPLGADNSQVSWQYSDPQGNGVTQALISQSYATSALQSDSTRTLIIDSTSAAGGCTSLAPTYVKDIVIYFVRNSILYRRTINGPNPCGGTGVISEKQTCASATVSGNSSVCKSSDAVLLTGVSTFSINYYAQAIGGSPMSPSSATIPTAKAIDITLGTSRIIDGKPNVVSTTLKVVITKS